MQADSRNLFHGILRELETCLGAIHPESLDRALEEMSAAKRLFLAGCGRSGLAIRGFAMRLMHMGLNVHVVGETSTPAIHADDCLVIGSGSGRTASLVAMAGKAREIGAKIVLFTIDPKSPIAQRADVVVVIPSPSPKAQTSAPAPNSIQPMGTLFEQSLYLTFDALVVALMRERGVTSDQMFARHANLE